MPTDQAIEQQRETAITIWKTFSIEQAIYGLGLIFFGVWLLQTSFGRKALNRIPERRHTMPAYLPLLALIGFMTAPGLMIDLWKAYGPDVSGYQKILWIHVIFGLTQTAMIALFLRIGQVYFIHRLRGMGLGFHGFGRNLFGAVRILFVTWPLLMVAITLVMHYGQSVQGPNYTIERHEELDVLVEHHRWSVTAAVLILSVVIAPIAEELLFRGIIQTALDDHVRSPWQSVIFTAILFASVHQNPEHWPALLILGASMGYAYEKSGSLWQSILMHAMFNGITLVTFLQTEGA